MKVQLLWKNINSDQKKFSSIYCVQVFELTFANMYLRSILLPLNFEIGDRKQTSSIWCVSAIFRKTNICRFLLLMATCKLFCEKISRLLAVIIKSGGNHFLISKEEPFSSNWAMFVRKHRFRNKFSKNRSIEKIKP